jgi:site-specific DNA-adenine methylase
VELLPTSLHSVTYVESCAINEVAMCAESLRGAYADPPYIGQSKKHYGDHPDYAGEVDHEELIWTLQRHYDCWALSLSVAPHRPRSLSGPGPLADGR